MKDFLFITKLLEVKTLGKKIIIIKKEYATDHRIWWHETIKDKNLKLKYDWFVVKNMND